LWEFLGADAVPEALTPETVRVQLERYGRLPATIAGISFALRTLASDQRLGSSASISP
jgi:hypothetical protein